jgi:hypothetical protein
VHRRRNEARFRHFWPRKLRDRFELDVGLTIALTDTLLKGAKSE